VTITIYILRSYMATYK